MFLRCIRTGSNTPMIKQNEVYQTKTDYEGNTVVLSGVFELLVTHRTGTVWESRGENAAFKEVGSDL